ncbi:MAG: PDZ domain-containing protein [Rhodobacteraceae bacterium]|nr:PDZ domain-containing protein [Paracoccaceae bacterium]
MRSLSFARTAVSALALGLALPVTTGLVASFAPVTAQAASTLPAASVSRALGALLISVTPDVQSALGLTESHGVLVLAVDPNGVAAKAGIEAGDVIVTVDGRAVKDPKHLDAAVLFLLNKGTQDFPFKGKRKGADFDVATLITLELFNTVLDLTTISTWTSYSYESFSYSEYIETYSSEISETYTSEESEITEMASSEEFATEMESEDLDADGDGIPDAEDNDDDNDGIPDDQDTDDDGDGIPDDADGADDPAADDDGDGTPNGEDTDDDNDGTPDDQDNDDDGDGTPDNEE